VLEGDALRDRVFRLDEFTYDAERQVNVMPDGQLCSLSGGWIDRDELDFEDRPAVLELRSR
jgi:hypothetical protein